MKLTAGYSANPLCALHAN